MKRYIKVFSTKNQSNYYIDVDKIEAFSEGVVVLSNDCIYCVDNEEEIIDKICKICGYSCSDKVSIDNGVVMQ